MCNISLKLQVSSSTFDFCLPSSSSPISCFTTLGFRPQAWNVCVFTASSLNERSLVGLLAPGPMSPSSHGCPVKVSVEKRKIGMLRLQAVIEGLGILRMVTSNSKPKHTCFILLVMKAKVDKPKATVLPLLQSCCIEQNNPASSP